MSENVTKRCRMEEKHKKNYNDFFVLFLHSELFCLIKSVILLNIITILNYCLF